MTRDNLLTSVVVALLVFFTLPAWVGLASLVFQQFRGDTDLGRFFFLTLFQPTPVWDLVRTGLAASIAGIAALSASDKWNVRTGVVVIAVLMMFVPIIVMFLYLLDSEHAKEIWQVVDQGERAGQVLSSETFDRVWNAYVAGQLQVLATHLALFLGLQKRSAA